jgi:hypothetical protein
MSARQLIINISARLFAFLPFPPLLSFAKVVMCNKLFGVNKAFQAVIFLLDTELFIPCKTRSKRKKEAIGRRGEKSRKGNLFSGLTGFVYSFEKAVKEKRKRREGSSSRKTCNSMRASFII